MKTDISLDSTSSPQKETVASDDSAKEQSTVKKETSDFLFLTMKSSLVKKVSSIVIVRIDAFAKDMT